MISTSLAQGWAGAGGRAWAMAVTTSMEMSYSDGGKIFDVLFTIIWSQMLAYGISKKE